MNTDRAAGGCRRIAPIPHRKIAMQVVDPSERILRFRVDRSTKREGVEIMLSRRDVHARLRNRVFLISALSAMAYVLSSPSALPQASQGGVSGQQAFNNACRTCHMVKEGDNRLGPNLYKIVGRKAGSLPDYAFSSAMKEADLVWDEEKLDRFIAKPDEVVPGNNMKPYGGLASSDDRKKIIAFLAQQQ